MAFGRLALVVFCTAGCEAAVTDFDVLALPPREPLDASVLSSLDAPAGLLCQGRPVSVTIEVTGRELDLDVAATVGGAVRPAVLVIVGFDATLGASTASRPALSTEGLSADALVCVVVEGRILGAGGDGGSGGNGGTGGGGQTSDYCGRPGQPGGPALRLTVPTELEVSGLIAGGGGGGEGFSGCNASAGGGGGAGSTPGRGGAGATMLDEDAELAYCGQDNGIRDGTPGREGTTALGGAGGRTLDGAGGPGGAIGEPGGTSTGCVPGNAAGAPSGAAIERDPSVRIRITGDGTIIGRERTL